MAFYSFETISFLSEVVNFMLMLYCNACSMHRLVEVLLLYSIILVFMSLTFIIKWSGNGACGTYKCTL